MSIIDCCGQRLYLCPLLTIRVHENEGFEPVFLLVHKHGTKKKKIYYVMDLVFC